MKIFLKTLSLMIAGLVFLGIGSNTAEARFSVPWVATSTSQGWIFPSKVNGVEQAVLGTIFMATSTSATSTFAGGLTIEGSGFVYDFTTNNVGIGTTSPGSLLSLGNTGANTINISPTATSTFGSGINILTGCFAINNVCTGSGSGSGTVGTGTTGQFPYYAANGTTLTATSSLFLATSGNVGIGTASPLAKLHVGSGTTNASVDSQVLISRAVNDTLSGNGHAFSDSSAVTRSGTIAYNSYDARITFSGTNNYDHYAAFQAAPVYGSSGILDKYYALFTGIQVDSGTIVDSYGAYLSNPTGAGAITNNYGIYIPLQTKGATNYAIYTAGTTPSVFGGLVSAVGGMSVASTSAGAEKTPLIVTNSSSVDSTATAIGFSTATGGTTITGKIASERVGGSNYALKFFNFGGSGLVEQMRLNAAGNLGIGTSTPNWLLQVAGTRPSIALSDTAGGTNLKHWLFSSMGGNLYVGTSTDAYATSTPAALTLSNAGKIGVGTTSPWRTLSVTGTVGFDGLGASGAGDTYVCISTNKELLTGATCAASTRKIKENITPLTAGLDIISRLQPVAFKYKDGFYGGKNDLGFIAEDVAAVDPRLALYDEKGEPLNVNERAILATLTKAIQEQQAEIDDLRKQVNGFYKVGQCRL